MKQYLNRFTKKDFVIDAEKITEAYCIYRVTAPVSDEKTFWNHITVVRNEIKKEVKPFGSAPGDDKTECYFISKTPFTRTDVLMQRVGSAMFQRLPLYIKGNILLTITGFNYSDFVTEFLLPLPIKVAEGEEFCQRFIFCKDEDNDAVLSMFGKTLTKKEEFTEKELNRLEAEGVQLTSYSVNVNFAYANEFGAYYGRKVERRNFMRNSLRYAFSMDHIKKEEDIQKQKLPLFLQVYQLLQKSEYVVKMEPDSVEVERIQNGLQQYKALLHQFYERIAGEQYSVVFGNSITNTDKEALMEMLNDTDIPELEEINAPDGEVASPRFVLRDEPKGMTIYIIDENCSGRSKQQIEKHPSESDIDYQQTNINTEDAIIQHTAYDTLFKFDKDEELFVSVPVLLNLLLQLHIKRDAVLQRLSMMAVPGKYRFYNPHPVYDKKGKLIKTLADVMDYDNGKFDYQIGVPLDGYSYPMGRDRMIQYMILQKTDDVENWPQLTVYDSDIFAIPKPDVIMEVIEDKTNSQQKVLPVKDLWNILKQTYDEIPDQESYEKYGKILESCSKKTIKLSKLKGRNTRFKRVLESKLSDRYGVKLSYSVKSQAYIDENYPSFFQITTCEDGIFVPSFQNPTQGLNSLPTAIHLKKTIWEGGEFKDELLQMLYNPYGKFKQLSFRPLPIKLLRELARENEEER